MRAEDAWNMAADGEVNKAKEAREFLFMEINNAANSGLYSIEIFSNISEELKKELIGLGYQVKVRPGTSFVDYVFANKHSQLQTITEIAWDK